MTRRRRARWLTRPWRRARARLSGHFWLPCPLCGEPFAGFEAATMLAVPTGTYSSSTACRVCEDEWITATLPLCMQVGHDPTPIWHGRQVRRERTAVEMCSNLSEGPDEVRCERCHVQLAVRDGRN